MGVETQKRQSASLRISPHLRCRGCVRLSCTRTAKSPFHVLSKWSQHVCGVDMGKLSRHAADLYGWWFLDPLVGVCWQVLLTYFDDCFLNFHLLQHCNMYNWISLKTAIYMYAQEEGWFSNFDWLAQIKFNCCSIYRIFILLVFLLAVCTLYSENNFVFFRLFRILLVVKTEGYKWRSNTPMGLLG